MKTILIAFMLNISFAFSAHADIGIQSAKKQWHKYLDCARYSDQSKKMVSCVEDVLSSELIVLEKQKLLSFLDQKIPFDDIHECSNKDLIQPNKINPNESVFCFQLKGLQGPSYGYVSFKAEAKLPRISKVKFKY